MMKKQKKTEVYSEKQGRTACLRYGSAWRSRLALLLSALAILMPQTGSAASQEDLKIAVFRAVRDGDLQKVQAALNSGADINCRINNNGSATLLLYCAANDGKNKKQMIALLLANGADVNAQARHRVTALHCLLMSDNSTPDMMEMLLQKGADPNAAPDTDITPLTMAVYRAVKDPSDDNLGFVQVLIQYNADPNVKSGPGRATPIEFANAIKNPVSRQKILSLLTGGSRKD